MLKPSGVPRNWIEDVKMRTIPAATPRQAFTG
jgi:hypothetical protein